MSIIVYTRINEEFDGSLINRRRLIYRSSNEFTFYFILILLLSFIILIFNLINIDATIDKREECYDILDNCENSNMDETILPPFVDYLQDFVVNERYNISFCLIPKVFSTVGTAMFCYLNDPQKFENSNRTIIGEDYDNRFCQQNERKTYKAVKSYYGSSNFENLIITRNPIDRFVSGFVDKCVNQPDINLCHGCRDDVKCFIRKQYRRLKRISMLFPVYTLADTHFAPQTWFCKMNETYSTSTVVSYANDKNNKSVMVQELSDFFRRNEIEQEMIEKVMLDIKESRTNHSTVGNVKRKLIEATIRNDERILRSLVRMYYYDFINFGYDLPVPLS